MLNAAPVIDALVILSGLVIPILLTVIVRSLEVFTATLPKSNDEGEILIVGPSSAPLP